MILTLPSMYPRPDRSHQNDPAVFGNACETWRSTFTEKKPGTPQVLLIEQSARDELLAHFHACDQFQVFIQGEGKLGKHALRPVSIHYTNRYTGYGPIVAGGTDFQYFVLRPSFDPLGFGQYLWKPELREKLRAHPGPKRVLMADVALTTQNVLAGLRGAFLRTPFCDRERQRRRRAARGGGESGCEHVVQYARSTHGRRPDRARAAGLDRIRRRGGRRALGARDHE